MTTTATPTVCDCGHPPTPQPPGAGGTGYGTTSDDGRTHCYACCDARSLRDILAAKPGDRSFAYLADDDRTVTSWTGAVLLRVVRCWETREGFAGHYGPPRTVRIWAVDTAGNWWSGRGPRDSGTYVRLRRLKGEPR